MSDNRVQLKHYDNKTHPFNKLFCIGPIAHNSDQKYNQVIDLLNHVANPNQEMKDYLVCL